MNSSGIQIGVWHYLKWRYVWSIEKNGELVAAKLIVYAEEEDECFTFILKEAYQSLKEW